MALRKKTSVRTGVLKRFLFDQPFVGFRTQFRSTPIKGKGKVQTHTINYGGDCREELVWDSREFLQNKSVRWSKKRNSWEKIATLSHTLDLDHPTLRQPEVTYLWVNGEDDFDGTFQGTCRRACCIGKFPELMDAIVGPVAVLLNPDRYVGNWWRTLPEEVRGMVSGPYHQEEMRWYGTDNFFLRHPALTSLMMGMFRQGVLLFQQDYDQAILEAVKRKDVEDCLTNADPVLAMRILKALRPWIEVPRQVDNFSFGKGYWDRLRLLHRAIYRHGYDALFDADLQHSWNIATEGGKGDRYSVSKGPMEYWGTTGSRVTPEGKRLAKLGK